MADFSWVPDQSLLDDRNNSRQLSEMMWCIARYVKHIWSILNIHNFTKSLPWYVISQKRVVNFFRIQSVSFTQDDKHVAALAGPDVHCDKSCEHGVLADSFELLASIRCLTLITRSLWQSNVFMSIWQSIDDFLYIFRSSHSSFSVFIDEVKNYIDKASIFDNKWKDRRFQLWKKNAKILCQNDRSVLNRSRSWKEQVFECITTVTKLFYR